MIDLDGIAMIWRRDLICFFRERSRLLGAVSRPILWLFVLGTGLRPTFRGANGLNYTQFIFPGIIAMTLIFTSIQSAISIIWDREFGFLKAILVAPMPRTSVAVGKALSGATVSMIQGIITLIFAPFVGVHLSLAAIAMLLPVIFIVSFGLTGIGIIIAGRMTSFEGFGTISNFLVMPMYFLSGAIFPPTGLPDWLTALVRLNPMTYGVDALRAALLHNHYFPLGLDLGVLVVFAALVTGVAVATFGRAE
jgi:ABC-2 type transport system permease protein